MCLFTLHKKNDLSSVLMKTELGGFNQSKTRSYADWPMLAIFIDSNPHTSLTLNPRDAGFEPVYS